MRFAVLAALAGLAGFTGLAACSSATAGPGLTAPVVLDLVPNADWIRNNGNTSPPCSGCDNPQETSFAGMVVPTGLCGGIAGQLSTAMSNRSDCCACIRRTKRFAMPTVIDASSVMLGGIFHASHGASDTFSAASFTVELFRAGKAVGRGDFATEARANNNCAADISKVIILPATPPATAPCQANFDVALDTIAPGETFDSVELSFNHYACDNGTTQLDAENFSIH